jgi:PAS domain S-box-containing protein
MQPPPPPSSQAVHSLPSTLSTAGLNGVLHATIAPMPGSGSKILPGGSDSSTVSSSSGRKPGDKKQQKRAANRRSAQLSRKRKKQFIEELKEENDELRRKEQILRSIPDLIVVFDSSGKLGFVSQSVSRFLDMEPEELEGTSFWDRMCEDSVRLLKAAFMDSLAARRSEADTAPLGSGVWELRLMDKDGKHKVITLNGVVHFSGEAPECVCCIRPRDQQPAIQLPGSAQDRPRKKVAKSGGRTVSSSGSDESQQTTSSSGNENNQEREHPQIRIKAGQSVLKSSSSSGSVHNTGRRRDDHELQDAADGGQAVRISDGDSGSIASESGSDEQ